MYLSSRLVVVLCCLLISQVLGAPDLIIKNSCSFGLWAEARGRDNSLIPGESNPIKFVAANGGTVSYTVPNTGLPTTRFWVKYGCNSNGANCAIGDQIPNTNIYPNGGCPANGCTPPLDSLFEATWGCKLSSGCPAGSSSVTWFDTSQVDGFTLPYRVLITGNTQCDCTGSGCTNLQLIDGSRLNLANCPSNEDMSYFGQYPTYANQNLRYTVNGQVVACKSPCKHFTLPAIQSGRGVFEGSMPAVYYCCPTPNPSNCQPSQGCVTPEQCRAGPIEGTQYVNLVHAQTDNVYAYTYDDLVGLHTCPASGVQYTMEYCPPGSPAYPYTPGSSSGGATATGSSSSSSGSTGGCTTNTCGAGLSCCNTYNNGPACYSPSQYSCATNNLGQRVLCPAGYSACGDACYNPSQYNCVNGQLQPR